MKEIPLTQGKVALVDDEDFEALSQFKWAAVQTSPGKWYAYRRAGNRHVSMHRDLLPDVPVGLERDHINRNGLDNQRCNLRLATRGQNAVNCAPRRKAKYKGVTSRGDKGFQAQVRMNGKCHYLGLFSDEETAARAYDAAAYEIYGEFAYLNFPDDKGRVKAERRDRLADPRQVRRLRRAEDELYHELGLI